MIFKALDKPIRWYGMPLTVYTKEEIIEYCNKTYGHDHPITIETIRKQNEINTKTER